MRPSQAYRLITAIFIAVITIGLLVGLLLITDTALRVLERFDRVPPALIAGYFLLLLSGAGFVTWRLWRLVSPKPEPKDVEVATPVTRAALDDKLSRASEQGASVSAAQSELAELDRRRASAQLYIAVVGEVSVGKSSLIQALVPTAEVQTDVLAGTTKDASFHCWQGDGLDLVFVDLPGVAEADGGVRAQIAMLEALRAHLVIYVCDGDLNRNQAELLGVLNDDDKPLIVVLNKADRFSDIERETLLRRLRERADSALRWVEASAGGWREVEVVDADGNTWQQRRARAPQIVDLRAAVIDALKGLGAAVHERQTSSSLRLADAALQRSLDRFRAEQAQNIVDKYSKRAVVGALAAIAPGSDLVIQGVLATGMLKELSALYGIETRGLDLDKFVKLAGGRVRQATAVLLAVVGNAFKAFPGLGTVSGGLMHAVAYGMIFKSLGTAAAQTMASEGHLDSELAAKRFEMLLNDNVGETARHFAAMAIDARRRR